MWCLSRKPSLNTNVLSRTSIFSFDQTLFQDISIIITENQPEEEEEGEANNYHNNPWQYFTYEASPELFLAVAIPRKTQIISVLPEYFLCARTIFSKSKSKLYGKLCTYYRKRNELVDVPSPMEMEQGYDRDLFTAACGILGGWLYIAGGGKAPNSSSYVDNTPLDSAERLNIAKLKWEILPPLLNPVSGSKGVALKGRFYVIGDQNYAHSAQIYRLKTNTWFLATHFIPPEANGYTVGSANGRMVLLTWSDYRGVKLWLRVDAPLMSGRWQVVHFYPADKVERARFHQNGAQLVRVGREVFVIVGANRDFCWVDGLGAWPISPPPFFKPSGNDEQRVLQSGYVSAFLVSRANNGVLSRQYPLYRIGVRH